MSCNRFIEIWGTGSGPLRRFAPQTRLLAGIGLFVACLIPSPDRLTGFLFVAITTIAWLIAARPPARVLGRLVVVGLIFFTPFFLLIPWVEKASCPLPLLQRFTDREAVSVAFRIFSKGFASLLIFSATAASLTLSEFYQGHDGQVNRLRKSVHARFRVFRTALTECDSPYTEKQFSHAIISLRPRSPAGTMNPIMWARSTLLPMCCLMSPPF